MLPARYNRAERRTPQRGSAMPAQPSNIAPPVIPAESTVGDDLALVLSPEPTPAGYGDAAPIYLDAGWTAALPLPPGKKASPPRGFTGAMAPDPSPEQVDQWRRRRSSGNIALRLPDGVIGLDVDHYEGKEGDFTLRGLEARLGPLPATWISSSRQGVSGIGLYRVPVGLAWPGGAGHDIDVIQHGHRYAVVWPSVHPEGRMYRWTDPTGVVVDTVPRPDELPELPPEYVQELTAGRAARDPESRADVDDDFRGRVLTSGDPCPALTSARATYEVLKRKGARHDAMNKTVLALVRHGERGHHGARAALRDLGADFMADLAGERREAEAEFRGSLAGALELVAGSPTPEDERGCCDVATDDLAADVERQVRKLRIEAAARKHVAAEEAAGQRAELPPALSLSELLALPRDPVAYRIRDLLPVDGRALLTARAKTGKTTLITALVRSLVDGGKFLDRFDVTPVGRVMVIDLEMTSRQLAGWYERLEVDHPERVSIWALRGRASALDPRDEAIRSDLAARLREADVQVLIIDPIGPAIASLGIDENSNSEVGEYLTALDSLTREAGVRELIIVHHAGHKGNRSRGASKFEDWPDALWRLSRGSTPELEAADDGNLLGQLADREQRYFRAEGRDVDVPRAQLLFDPATGALSLFGREERREEKDTAGRDHVVATVRARPGLSQNKLVEALGEHAGFRNKPAALEAIRSATEAGVIRRVPDGQAVKHYPAEG